MNRLTKRVEPFPPDVFRGLAESYLFVADLAQLFVIRHVHRASAELTSTTSMEESSYSG